MGAAEADVADILVRDLADEVVESLTEAAQKRHRSLEAEVKAILEEAAKRGPSPHRRQDFLAELDRLRAEMAGRATTDSVELLREAREERERRWDTL